MRHYFDTETSGLPQGWQRDYFNYKKFPIMLEYAGVLVDDQHEVMAWDRLIKPPYGFIIGAEATAVHGLTYEKCMDEGVPLNEALDVHWEMTRKAKMHVGFNLDFDHGIIETAMYRAKAEHSYTFTPVERPQQVDLKNYATPLCAIPPTPKMIAAKRMHFKTPTLTEAMLHVCKHDHSGAHRAMPDVRACILLHRTIKELMDDAKLSQQSDG